jgi:Fusaric acid resistance protein-like
MAVSQVATVFKFDSKKVNLGRGVVIAVVLLLPLVVLTAIHQEQYWVSLSFGALFMALADPGGEYGYRVSHIAGFAVIGAALTALGFGIGGGAWGWVVLAAFVVTLLAGLAVKYGLHRFFTATLLNVWFLIVLSLPAAYRLDHIHTNAWQQALAWLIGSALWIAVTFIVWLARGRASQQQPAADMIPGSTAPVPLSRQVIGFAVLRTVAITAAVAIAFGLHLPYADWMPVAALAAMQTSLQQSTVIAIQRVAGTVIGAVVAIAFLLSVDSKPALAVIIALLGALAGALRSAGYTWYALP